MLEVSIMDARMTMYTAGIKKFAILVTHHSDATEVVEFLREELATVDCQYTRVYHTCNTGGAIGFRCVVKAGVVDATMYSSTGGDIKTGWEYNIDDQIQLEQFLISLSDSVRCLVDGTSYWQRKLKQLSSLR